MYQGREYSASPEAVLREMYGDPRAKGTKIVRPENALENLRLFFESKRRKKPGGAI